MYIFYHAFLNWGLLQRNSVVSGKIFYEMKLLYARPIYHSGTSNSYLFPVDP